jgi:hypothetical protein
MIDQVCSEMFGEGVDVNPLQPLRDATDAAAAPHAGWELALEYCEQRAAAALEANDYVVIHLDTDQGEHPNFGLPLTHQGVDRPYDDLVADAIEIIVNRLGKELYHAHVERFLFAISVHSMESWLLLRLFDLDEPKNSFDRVNRRLKKRDQAALVKTARAYLRLAREIKRKRLLELTATNNSLGLFLAKLAGLGDTAAEV